MKIEEHKLRNNEEGQKTRVQGLKQREKGRRNKEENRFLALAAKLIKKPTLIVFGFSIFYKQNGFFVGFWYYNIKAQKNSFK